MAVRDSGTIAAIATATGTGGIGVIRISGDNVTKLAEKILGTIPKPRYAVFQPFYGQQKQVIDEGIAILFKGPNSYTGEDVLELQCHGGHIVMDMLLSAVLTTGLARQAEAGEFTERAFLNGKIDLSQAEAIADLINASSAQAASSAVNSMQGVFSRLVNDLNDRIIRLRTYVEATIDFPDESIDFIDDGQVMTGLLALSQDLQQIMHTAKQGLILQEGLKIVIAGRPNAGKSSLLNLLCGQECAIVTDIEGTTRDVLRENITIDGMPLHIVDTAGLRTHTSDVVEKIGIERAWNEIMDADRILFVYDVSREDPLEQLALYESIKAKTKGQIPFSIICNKVDIHPTYTLPDEFKDLAHIAISANNRESLATLHSHLKECAGFENTSEGVFSARRRHITALESADKHLNKAIELVKEQNMFELSAEELRLAHNNLNEILGRYTADDLLGNIFNTFCVGK